MTAAVILKMFDALLDFKEFDHFQQIGIVPTKSYDSGRSTAARDTDAGDTISIGLPFIRTQYLLDQRGRRLSHPYLPEMCFILGDILLKRFCDALHMTWGHYDAGDEVRSVR